MKVTTKLLDEIDESADGTTAEEFHIGPIDEIGSHRTIMDSNGYTFAQVDDDGNRRHMAKMGRKLTMALTARVRELEVLLARHGDHAVSCPLAIGGKTCSCGWIERRKEFRP